MIELLQNPALLLLLGAMLMGVLPRLIRGWAFLLFPALSLVFLWTLPDGYSFRIPFAGYDLVLFQLDALSRILAPSFPLLELWAASMRFTIRIEPSKLTLSSMRPGLWASPWPAIILLSSSTGN